MKLHEVVAHLQHTPGAAMSRLHLLHTRGGAQIRFVSHNRPLQMFWPDGRCEAWVPTPDDLMHKDWTLLFNSPQ